MFRRERARVAHLSLALVLFALTARFGGPSSFLARVDASEHAEVERLGLRSPDRSEEAEGGLRKLAGSRGKDALVWVYGVGIDEPIRQTRKKANGQLKDQVFYCQNAIGSVVALTDASGAVVERYKYLAFGQEEIFDGAGVKRGSSAFGNPYRFQGRWRDQAEGSPLVYFRARYYDPKDGRFTTRDPIGTWGDAGQLGNAYGAFGCSPATFTDPFGFARYYSGRQQQLEGELARIRAEILKQEGRFFTNQNILDSLHSQEQIVGKWLTNQIKTDRERGEAGDAGVVDLDTPQPTGDGYYIPDANPTGLQKFVTLATGYEANLNAPTPINDSVDSYTMALGATASHGIGQGMSVATQAEINLAISVVAAGVEVYRSINPATGEVQYIGITKDFNRRKAAHLRCKGIEIDHIPGLQNLTRDDARAVEQALIEFYGGPVKAKDWKPGDLLNRINSIAKTDPDYASKLARGAGILTKAGYAGF